MLSGFANTALSLYIASTIWSQIAIAYVHARIAGYIRTDTDISI